MNIMQEQLTTGEKEEIVVEFLQDANTEEIFHITTYLMMRLAREAIDCNAQVLKMSTSIHPKGVDERRDIALLVFQERQSKNKVKDLSSLLQAAPDLLEALVKMSNHAKQVINENHPDYQLAQKAIDAALGIDE